MHKKDRDIIFNKYGGRCAYCGCELIKGWHVDHIEPVNRLQKRKEGYYKHKETGVKITQDHLPEKWFIDYIYVRPGLVYDKMQNPERDTLDNSMPSCHSCNNYKNTFDLETFRKQIGLLISRLNKSITQYKIVKRYGLIQETAKPVIFYFETVQSQQETITQLQKDFMSVQTEMQVAQFKKDKK